VAIFDRIRAGLRNRRSSRKSSTNRVRARHFERLEDRMLLAVDINVANRSEFLAALKVVTPGDTIKLAPGIYSQGTSSDFAWVSNVHGKANAYITITAQDPNNPPVIRDNKVGLVIADSSYIRVSNLKFDANINIGLYIKGGRVSSDTLSPSHHIIAENLTILNTGRGGSGNDDGIKIGATDHFTVQNVRIEGWGQGGGSAMDIVSSQYGLIQDSQFVHVKRSATGSDQGVTMKGGSRDILVQNNFFHHAGDIAVSIGQDTGLSFFRDPIGSVLADGSRFNYEAKDIEVAGNIFVGGARAPIQFQKSSGGSVHHNTFARPNNNIAIIALSENDGLLRAHDGRVANNLIVYNWGNLMSSDPFIGRGTATNPAKYTFGFENNAWYQLDAATAGLKMPSTSDPSKLLTNESGAVYQVNPEFSVNLATANLANLKPSDLVIRSTNPALANVGADAWRSGGDTTIPNVAPSLTAAAANPVFTENGAAVTLYSGTTINLGEATDKVRTLVLTVAGLQNGSHETLVVDGRSVPLTNGTTGITTATGINYSVAVASGKATVTLTMAGDMTVAQAQTLVNGLKYQNASEDPWGTGRTVSLTSIQDSGGTANGGIDTTALNVASAVAVRAVNDAPTLTATAASPNFTVGGAAVPLYSGAAINAAEAADKVRSLKLTVAGLQNGSQEILVVDGTSVALTHGNAGTTSATGINYSVAVVSGTATVTLAKAGDMTPAQAQTLVNGLQYRNASAQPLGSGRTVTLTSIQDSGGTANGGIDAQVLSIASVVTIKTVDNVVEAVYLRTGVVSASSSWMTVTLDHSYANMVVVATPTYQAGAPPVVTRIRNAGGNSFQVRVQRADSSTAAISGVSVQYLVVEAGVYTQAQHGVKMEAVKYNSTVTDRRGSWVGQQRTYANTYASPVVVGQVMTVNDPGFSVFWARGGSAGAAPSGKALSVGKHVGEDPIKTRANEVIGYIVIEAGSGAIGGRAFQAGVGANVVYGVDNKLSAAYALNALTSPTNAVLSSAGMVGNDGGWAVLNGSTPVTAGGLNLVIDEDRRLDVERYHPAERVAYLAFDGSMSAVLSLSEGEMAGTGFDSMSAPENAESLSAVQPWGPATVWNMDVTGDEHLTPGDVVVLINHLNAPQLGEGLKGVLDVNRDGTVGALDVLTLINHLNTFGAQDLVSWELGTLAGAEGENSAAAPAAANDAVLESEIHSADWPIPLLDAEDDEDETATFWTPDQGTEPSGLESVLEEIAREVDLSWSAASE